MPKSVLFFDKPIMNAAGTLGFVPDFNESVDISEFGAFVTNPISRTPRTPAGGTRFIPYMGGFLLHTGLPNPGLSQAIRHHGRRWAQSPVPVIVHLLAINPDELSWMVERLETVDGVMGIEVGLPPDADPSLAYHMAQASFGELPVIMRVPLDGNMDLFYTLIDENVSAISLGAPRGTLLNDDDHPVTGRLYGPSIFPLALKVVENLSGLGIPIIGSGGIYQTLQAETMLKAGATAIQLDAVLWKDSITPIGASVD